MTNFNVAVVVVVVVVAVVVVVVVVMATLLSKSLPTFLSNNCDAEQLTSVCLSFVEICICDRRYLLREAFCLHTNSLHLLQVTRYFRNEISNRRSNGGMDMFHCRPEGFYTWLYSLKDKQLHEN